MEAIMSFYNKPKGKEGEALLEKDIQAWDTYTFNNEELLTSEHLDNEKAIAWGSYMGILLGDFKLLSVTTLTEQDANIFLLIIILDSLLVSLMLRVIKNYKLNGKKND